MIQLYMKSFVASITCSGTNFDLTAGTLKKSNNGETCHDWGTLGTEVKIAAGWEEISDTVN